MYQYIYADIENFEFGWLSPDGKAVSGIEHIIMSENDFEIDNSSHNKMAYFISANLNKCSAVKIFEDKEKFCGYGGNIYSWLEKQGWVRLHNWTVAKFIDTGKLTSKQKEFIEQWAEIRKKEYKDCF